MCVTRTYFAGKLVSCFSMFAEVDSAVAAFAESFVFYNFIEVHTSIKERKTGGV